MTQLSNDLNQNCCSNGSCQNGVPTKCTTNCRDATRRFKQTCEMILPDDALKFIDSCSKTQDNKLDEFKPSTQNPTQSPTQNPTQSPTQNPTQSPTQNLLNHQHKILLNHQHKIQLNALLNK